MHEKLLVEAEKERIKVVEFPFQKVKGLYCEKVIGLRQGMTTAETVCVLVEELGHYHTSSGDILDQSNIINRKQERRACAWGYERLVPLGKLINAYEAGVQSRHDLAEYLTVTEEFLLAVLKYYREKHGLQHQLGNYIIYFEPLMIFKAIND
ncbi:MAG: ImmA/IrrE family metallo-endopeptidase [Firmicutes bacterium]|nr:ImmA/IrrE family metallo-endopeptidase [Bacillota bacterium]